MFAGTKTELRLVRAFIDAGANAGDAVAREMAANGIVKNFRGAFQLCDALGVDRDSFHGRFVTLGYLQHLPAVVIASEKD